MTTNIYVLKLQGGRYYVGKAADVIGRYQEHVKGNGSAWTNKYPPLSLVESRDNVSPFMEDMVVKEYMAKYGIDKVRGGSYVTDKLSDFHIDALNMEIWAAKDCCTRCGRRGHFIRDCVARADVSGNSLYIYACEKCDREFDDEKACKTHEISCRGISIKCYNCRKHGHPTKSCREKRVSYDSDSDWESDWESESESD